MKTSLAALMIGLLAGCATQSNQESSSAPAPAPSAMSTPPGVRSAPATSVAGVRTSGKSMPQAHSVYYDYDRSEIKSEDVKLIEAHAQYLREHTELKVKVEGNADERGSAEYNLALGTRRATSVKDYLVSLGVPASRLTVVSKGKEQPFCAEESESCWQQNRRGHFIVTAK